MIRRLMLRCYQAFVVFLCGVHGATASAGGREQIFVQCVARCIADSQCEELSAERSGALWLLVEQIRWSYVDECRYWCMHDRTAQRLSAGGEVLQYYGKWPFWRVCGMQEPASVFFSLLNLCAHLPGLRHLQQIPAASRSCYHGR